jgi:hypothetical protein
MKTFKELFAGTGIEPTTNENGGVDYNFNATLKKEQLTGTVTLSQPLPSTSIFATTIDGELTDVINIKDSFNRLPKEEKLKIVSVLLEFCAMETCNLINQNK